MVQSADAAKRGARAGTTGPLGCLPAIAHAGPGPDRKRTGKQISIATGRGGQFAFWRVSAQSGGCVGRAVERCGRLADRHDAAAGGFGTDQSGADDVQLAVETGIAALDDAGAATRRDSAAEILIANRFSKTGQGKNRPGGNVSARR